MDVDPKHLYCDYIRDNLREWKTLADNQFEFELLRGLTNEVYKVIPKAEYPVSPSLVIFRKFNENSKLVDRPQERKLFRQLGDSELGPKCLADNEKYRVEEYIHSKTLYGPDYNKKEIRRGLAKAIAKFHRRDIEWIGKRRYLPDDLANKELCKPFEEKCNSEGVFDESQKEIVKKMKEITSEEELEFIKKIVPDDDIVLSHNDLSNGNQLLLAGSDEIMLIDYEYSGRNFRGFDIGYIYQQSVFTPNKEAPYFKVQDGNFPTDDEFVDFIHYYIVFSDISAEQEKNLGEDFLKDDEKVLAYLKENYEESEVERRVKRLLRESKIGALCCCHYITTWAIKMYKTVTYNFNHFEFAKEGFTRYLKYKQELLKSDSQ